jgi:acyl carrier protein
MIEQQLKDLLAKQFGIESANITNTDHLVNDLNADSLDLLEVVMSVEKEFNIQIEESEYQAANTVIKIAELVKSKLKATL